MLGQQVSTINVQKNSTHNVKWDGRDASGASVSTGLFYTLTDGNTSYTKKMALMIIKFILNFIFKKGQLKLSLF